MTTIDQQAALLRDICQRPDDTQARLVYADWCEDNGREARAEFIRVQVELSSLPSALPQIEGHITEWNAHAGQPVNFAVVIRRKDAQPGPFVVRHQQRDDSWFESSFESSPALIKSVEEFDPDRVKARCVFHECDTADWQRSQALRRRERELLETHGEAWLRHFPGDLVSTNGAGNELAKGRGDKRIVYTFRNGFVESITTTSAMWLAHGPQIVAATPVRTVRLTDKRPEKYGLSWCYWAEVELEEKLFPSEKSALDAISAAALAWARRQAGL